MAHVVVDPYVVAVPEEHEEYGRYVDALVEWMTQLSERRDECSISAAAVAVLMEERRFPHRTELARVLAWSGREDVSLVDILNLTRRVSETEPFLESHLELCGCEGTAVACLPAEVLARLGTACGSATEKSLLSVAVAHGDGWCEDGVYWATREWPWDRTIRVGATSVLVERPGGEILELGDVAAELGVLARVAEWRAVGSVAELYREPERAVALVLARLRESGLAVPAGEPVVVTGPDFVRSIEADNLQRSRRIVEAIFDRAALAAIGQLAVLRGADLHEVRESASADAHCVRRADGSRLLRCKISQYGAGWRLQYWELSGGGIELQKVVRESEV